MKTKEDLLSEISAASRITRDGRLLALFEELKVYLESIAPGSHVAPSLEPRTGRLPKREVQLRRNTYMREFMRKRRARQREQKLAIINSTSNSDRDQGAKDPNWSEANPELAAKIEKASKE